MTRNKYKECTFHFVKASSLDRLVDDAIRRVAKYVLTNQKEFLEQIGQLSDIYSERYLKEAQKDLKTAKNRIQELDTLIKNLYEGNVSGKIPDRHFERMMKEYDAEQQELEVKVEEMEQKLRQMEDTEENGSCFVRLVKKYQDFDEITPQMLYEFIDKIAVHEAEGGRGEERTQRIDMRIHNASSKIEPSLKFDVQLMAMPSSILTQIEPWTATTIEYQSVISTDKVAEDILPYGKK